MARLSFDIPDNEHLMLKTACVQARISIKDFMHSMLLKGLEELAKEGFNNRLKESIRQSKDGLSRIISSKELDEMFDE